MKNFIISIFFCSGVFFIQNNLFAQQKSIIIPQPVQMEFQIGEFDFSENTLIYFENDVFWDEVNVFNSSLNTFYGFTLRPVSVPIGDNYIYLFLDTTLANEEYYLEMTPEFIRIRGNEAGVFYGLQSVLQMLPPTIDSQIALNCVNIHDYPRFQWRGMHLDVSRHFFPKEFIFKYLDYLAYYKMNTFHWHLTDDQGWRIEIKRYPLLTELGAWRKGTLIGHSSDEEQIADTARYGGFYTQDDIREVVAYAQARHITIVPEIEMPGHSMAALKGYPFLSCTGNEQDVSTGWGVFDHVFCTTDTVFTFLENVLTEVMDLFPGTYIHVGGDECPKGNWKKCPQCQQRMKSEGLKDENELQSYFIKRIEVFINSNGRKLIGWDEILEGGLAPNAAVMSWRGTEGGTEAAKQGHYVVMTPGSHCYFDHYQGDPTNEPLAIGGYTPVEKVYAYEPIPDELNESERHFILGAQGNVWTEYIDSEEHVEYMIFPRLCALAEVVWTPAEQKNWIDFRTRLIKHFDYFEHRNINHSMALFEIKKKVICDTVQRKIFVVFSQELNMGDISFWTENDNKSLILPQIYNGPIEVDGSYTVFAEVRDLEGNERGYTQQEFVFSKSSGAGIQLTFPPSSYYNYGSPYTLVDGVSGRVPWNGKEWLGFSNTNMEALIDLQKREEISTISVHTLKAEASWIYLPVSMNIEFSTDGKSFMPFGHLSSDDIIKGGRILTISKKPVKARYVKIFIEKEGIISAGKPGEGHNAWLFVSEIEIR